MSEKLTTLLVVHHMHEKYWSYLSNHEDSLEVTSIDNIKPVPFLSSSAEILFCWRFQADLLEKLPNLKWIAAASAGVDHIIEQLPKDSKIVVTKGNATIGKFMAQYTIQHILNHLNNYPIISQQKQLKEWSFVKSDLISRYTIGILGLGSIGTDIAEMAKSLGMRVLGAKKTSARTDRMEAACDEIYTGSDWQNMLPEVDFLLTLLPNHQDTISMIGTPEFKIMKNSAVLINIGRGSVVSGTALLHAVQTGLIAGAVLDVFEKEPLPAKHSLWNEKKVIITPHCAGPSEVEHVGQEFLDNYKRWKAGEPLHNVVDLTKGY